MSKEENFEENCTRQSDEIEALSAIYGEDFITVDEDSKIFEIRIKMKITSASLRFVIPPEYPSENPPEFEVQCGVLRREDEMEVIREFEQIADENVGECFLFQWAEKLREIVETKANKVQEKEANYPVPNQTNTSNADQVLVKGLTGAMKETNLQDGALLYHNIEQPAFEIAHGEPFTDRKSTFQAHLAAVESRNDIDQVLFQLKLNRKIANATHNIMAYRIFNAELNSYIQDCDDDGENAAGSRLLHLLQIANVKNVVIIVTRWYGGLLLGPDRFKHINNCARNLLESCGFVEGRKSNENKEPKGKRTEKMRKHK